MTLDPLQIPVVMAAVPIELRLLKKRLTFCRRIQTAKPLRLEIFQYEQTQVALAQTGMGPENVRKSFRELLKHLQPSAFFSIGLAGAVSSLLEIGDLILSNEALMLENLTPLQFARQTFPVPLVRHACCGVPLEAFLGKQQAGRVYCGGLVSSPVIIAQSEKKREIAAVTQFESSPLGVDMETHTLLEQIHLAGFSKLPFLSLRAISDTAAENLDFDFGRFFTREGDLRLKPFLAYLVSHPQLAYRFYRLHLACQKATTHLTRAITALLEPSSFPLWQVSVPHPDQTLNASTAPRP